MHFESSEPKDIQLNCVEKNIKSMTIRVDDVIKESSGYYKKIYKVQYNNMTNKTESNPLQLQNLEADTPYDVSVYLELEEINSNFGKRFKVTSEGHIKECWTKLGGKLR